MFRCKGTKKFFRDRGRFCVPTAGKPVTAARFSGTQNRPRVPSHLNKLHFVYYTFFREDPLFLEENLQNVTNVTALLQK